jgi:hypothetical protein
LVGDGAAEDRRITRAGSRPTRPARARIVIRRRVTPGYVRSVEGWRASQNHCSEAEQDWHEALCFAMWFVLDRPPRGVRNCSPACLGFP